MTGLGKIYEPVALDLVQSLIRTPLMDVGSLRYLSRDVYFEGSPDAVTCFKDSWIPFEVKTRAYPNPLDSLPYETKYEVPPKHWLQLQLTVC